MYYIKKIVRQFGHLPEVKTKNIRLHEIIVENFHATLAIH